MNITLLTVKTTYWPTYTNKIPDLMDLFIIKIYIIYHPDRRRLDVSSDHSPILLTLSNNIMKDNNPTLVNKLTD